MNFKNLSLSATVDSLKPVGKPSGDDVTNARESQKAKPTFKLVRILNYAKITVESKRWKRVRDRI